MTSLDDNLPPEGFFEKSAIEAKLLALESGAREAAGEDFRGAVREHPEYLVPLLRNERGDEEIFKIAGLYDIQSVPVFLSDEVYSLFQSDYLEKHGILQEIARRRETLVLKTLSGQELFGVIPQIPLGSVFILSDHNAELLFNFNLAEVFTSCFDEIWTDADLPIDSANECADELEIKLDEDSAVIRKSAERVMEKSGRIRSFFEHHEWIVLISQPTKNKLLKGEFSRDDFDPDRHGDGRIFIFSDAAALDDYSRTTGQPPEKLYNVKADRRRIFGSDLTGYKGIIINPHSSRAALVGWEYFKKLNELYAAFEIEGKLLETANFRKSPGSFNAANYIAIKDFQNYILPVDKELKDAGEASSDSFIDWVPDISGNGRFPIFTAKDCFEAFRLRCLEISDSEEKKIIEPYFIDGRRLFEKLSLMKTRSVVFNPEGPVRSFIFEPNFALKVDCA